MAAGIGTYRPSRSLALGLVFAATVSTAALAGVWTSNGPDGGAVTTLAIDPASPTKVYAGTEAGLFTSSDGGATWAYSRALPAGVRSIGIDRSGQRLYAATDHGVTRSSDGGAAWTGTSISDPIAIVALDPAKPSTVYAAGASGPIFRSDDGGSSWTNVNADAWQFITSLAVPPAATATAYLASSRDGVFKTSDGGASWSLLTTLDAALGPRTDNAYFVAVDPERSQRIYAARSSETGSHLCASDDGGSSWSCGGNLVFGVTALAFDHGVPGQGAIYAGTFGGLYKSTDGGTSWVRADAGLSGSPNALASAPDGTALLAGTAAGVFRSADHASHWDSSSRGLHASLIGALAVSPADPPTLVAGTSLLGIFRRSDNEEWQTLDAANPLFDDSFFYSLAVSPADPATIYAAGSRILLKTTDGGDHWSGISLPSDGARVLAIDPSVPSTVYAGSGGRFGDGGLSRSTDGGATWSHILSRAVYALLLDSLQPSTLYAGADFSAGYYGGGGGIFKSTDGGQNWKENVLDFGSSVTVLAIDPRSSSTLYAATRSSLYKSTDTGTTWISSNNGLSQRNFSAILVDPVVSERVYVGTDRGVFWSLDGGQSWSILGTGIPDLLAITTLAIDTDGRFLHAGTAGGGVFDYDLSSKSPCFSGPGSLCLLGNRFEVTFSATDPARNKTSAGNAVSQGDRFGYFSLPAFTGDPIFPEVLVKMADATDSPSRSFWFFYSGLTNLPYVVTVRDTATGLIRVYESKGYCGGADTSGFPGADANAQAPMPQANPATTLSASGNELLLLSNRFRVSLSATDLRTGRTSVGSAIAQDDRFGYFGLPDFTGDPSFPEVFVKMVDFTAITGDFWFFYTGLTHLAYTLTVTDTATGAARTYQSPGAFCGGADTSVFRATLVPGGPDISGEWTGPFKSNDPEECHSDPSAHATFSQNGSDVAGQIKTTTWNTCGFGGDFQELSSAAS